MKKKEVLSRQFKRQLLRGKATEDDIKYWQEKISKQAIDFTLDSYQHVIMLVLHDKLGFGRKRVKRFIEDVNETFKCVTEEYVTLEEIKERIKEELSLELIEHKEEI